jgi:hypothetical protein
LGSKNIGSENDFGSDFDNDLEDSEFWAAGCVPLALAACTAVPKQNTTLAVASTAAARNATLIELPAFFTATEHLTEPPTDTG